MSQAALPTTPIKSQSGMPLNGARRLRYLTRRTPYTRWIPERMPKLGKYERLLNCVFYLYRSKEDAEAGTKFGGTGYLTHIPLLSVPDRYWWIGVTNWHAAIQQGFSVVRINRNDGGADIFEFDPAEWHFLPGGPDVAAIPLNVGSSRHQVRAIGPGMYLNKECNQTESMRVNVGDDVFMIGRFIDYDGIETNRPSLRFGNISIMEAPIKQKTGHMGPSVVLDITAELDFPVVRFSSTGPLAHTSGRCPTGTSPKLKCGLGT
jgi:hypothetical protein